MVPFIEISLKSYEYQSIENSFQQLQEYIPSYWQLKSFFLPTRIKKFTLLRSPHIDKKSREQFQLKSCKKKIIIIPNSNQSLVTYNEIYLFLDNIKQCSFSGVQVQIQIVYKSYIN